MAFQGKPTKAARPATPEDLYNQLPRTQEAVKGLWLHQGDVIRRYVQDYAPDPDIALELPTGTGKTLPGLLIAARVGGVGHVTSHERGVIGGRDGHHL